MSYHDWTGVFSRAWGTWCRPGNPRAGTRWAACARSRPANGSVWRCSGSHAAGGGPRKPRGPGSASPGGRLAAGRRGRTASPWRRQTAREQAIVREFISAAAWVNDRRGEFFSRRRDDFPRKVCTEAARHNSACSRASAVEQICTAYLHGAARPETPPLPALV